jgi:hypothetical protein
LILGIIFLGILRWFLVIKLSLGSAYDDVARAAPRSVGHKLGLMEEVTLFVLGWDDFAVRGGFVTRHDVFKVK